MIERAVALLLSNAVWEPLAVAACAILVLRSVRNANAATRCAVLTAAILAALVLPIITTAAVYRGTPTSAMATPARSVPSRVLHTSTALHAPVADRITHANAATPPAPVAQRLVISVPRIAVLSIVVLWAAIALVLLMRLLVSLAHLSRLRHDALPISPQLRTKLRRWNEKAGGIDVRLCLSDHTVVPIAVGLFDCMVLIPRRLLEELEPADLDRIVLHEIAHLRRRDGIVYALQQIACALYFFSPAMFWLANTLDIEREVACDDLGHRTCGRCRSVRELPGPAC